MRFKPGQIWSLGGKGFKIDSRAMDNPDKIPVIGIKSGRPGYFWRAFLEGCVTNSPSTKLIEDVP